MSEQTLQLEDIEKARVVFGERDQHLLLIEQSFGIELLAKGGRIRFKGKAAKCKQALHLTQELYQLAQKGMEITLDDVAQAIKVAHGDSKLSLDAIFLDAVGKTVKGRPITPRTLKQKHYVSAMRNCDVVFGWGPAGTGKTYLAMAMAISALLNHEVSRIILTRPAVEAGEKLGFLPGDLAEKVNPYLRPLYDALHEMLEPEKTNHYISRNQIEVAPLAFMRGRTLNDSFVILDEAQNTTPEQMKMFLTRLGRNSKSVITGDITQVDLPSGSISGLTHVIKLLKNIKEIGFAEFSEKDVVRHELVRKIIRAYETQKTSKRMA